MPVSPSSMARPEDAESMLSIAQKNASRPKPPQKMFTIRNPLTGETAEVSQQNMRDRVRIDGWVVVPKNEGPPQPDAPVPAAAKEDEDVGETIDTPREPTELDLLRDEYERLSGKEADKRWGKKVLSEKIALLNDE